MPGKLNSELLHDQIGAMDLRRLTIDIDGTGISTGSKVAWVMGGYNPHHLSSDIKNVGVAAFHRNHVHAGKYPLQIFEVLKVSLHQLTPRAQRCCGVSMLWFELPDRSNPN
jgi:hypothetical protein